MLYLTKTMLLPTATILLALSVSFGQAFHFETYFGQARTPCYSDRRRSTPSSSSALGVSISSTTWQDVLGPQNSTAYGFQDGDYLQKRRLVQSPTTRSRSRTAREQNSWRLYCDLDGVLCDFEHGIRTLFPDVQGLQLQDLERSTMWKRVKSADRFFDQLPWTREGRQLWDAIRHLRPDILTGVPVHASSRHEKFSWCARELGVDVAHVDMAGVWNLHYPVNGAQKREDVCNVITCWSNNKHHESGPGAVLIDDREHLREGWEAKGGIFIHHTTGDIETTLQQLREHGILAEDDGDDVLMMDGM